MTTPVSVILLLIFRIVQKSPGYSSKIKKLIAAVATAVLKSV